MQRILRPRKTKALVTVAASALEIKPEPKKKISKPVIADDWKLFRKIAKESAPHKPRTSTPYSENYTASLAWRSEDTKSLFENEKKPEALLELCKDRVMEHAARRVDLFFYTLIAYHNSDLPPLLGWSKLQHGRGKINFKTYEGVTNAAHSSIATTIIDRTILDKTPLESKIEKSNLKIETSMLCTTHFMDSLNSTIELPAFINEFDFLVEFIRKGRDDSSKIIREVAEGKLDPIEGLLKFLFVMKNIFDNMLTDKNIFKSKTDLSLTVKRQLVMLQKTGTLINKLAKDEKSVNDEYVYMLLRLKPDEIAQCKSDVKAKNKILNSKMKEIREEIVSTPSQHIRMKR